MADVKSTEDEEDLYHCETCGFQGSYSFVEQHELQDGCAERRDRMSLAKTRLFRNRLAKVSGSTDVKVHFIDSLRDNDALRATLSADAEAVYHASTEGLTKSYWLASSDMEARQDLSLIEGVVADIYQHHLSGLTQSTHDDLNSGAEWWVQHRHISTEAPSTASLGWHFDRDVWLHDACCASLHPQLSSVTYLTDAGGPTCIVDRCCDEQGLIHPASPEAPKRMYLSHPSIGKHLSFDGGFLHCVPSELTVASPSCTSGNVRITLLVNLWLGHRPDGILCLPPELRLSLSQGSANPGEFSERNVLNITRRGPLIPMEFEFGPQDQSHTMNLSVPESAIALESVGKTLCWRYTESA